MQVRLKDVVDYVTGVVALNAVSSSLASCLPQLAASAAADFTIKGQEIVQQASGQINNPIQEAGGAVNGLSSHTRLQVDGCAESCVRSAAHQVPVPCKHPFWLLLLTFFLSLWF